MPLIDTHTSSSDWKRVNHHHRLALDRLWVMLPPFPGLHGVVPGLLLDCIVLLPHLFPRFALIVHPIFTPELLSSATFGSPLTYTVLPLLVPGIAWVPLQPALHVEQTVYMPLVSGSLHYSYFTVTDG